MEYLCWAWEPNQQQQPPFPDGQIEMAKSTEAYFVVCSLSKDHRSGICYDFIAEIVIP